ncbi:hypothetical protein K445DRAFT_113775 [Daldinia sp. EC12]|nr:hypothetical protein K445DRAFT_113775 [Daldinia sp. EC12]
MGIRRMIQPQLQLRQRKQRWLRRSRTLLGTYVRLLSQITALFSLLPIQRQLLEQIDGRSHQVKLVVCSRPEGSEEMATWKCPNVHRMSHHLPCQSLPDPLVYPSFPSFPSCQIPFVHTRTTSPHCVAPCLLPPRF